MTAVLTGEQLVDRLVGTSLSPPVLDDEVVAPEPITRHTKKPTAQIGASRTFCHSGDCWLMPSVGERGRPGNI